MLELFSVVRGQDQRRRRVSGGSEGDVGDSEEELGEGEDGREGVGGEEEESCCLVMERVRSGLFSCTFYRSLPFFSLLRTRSNVDHEWTRGKEEEQDQCDQTTRVQDASRLVHAFILAGYRREEVNKVVKRSV